MPFRMGPWEIILLGIFLLPVYFVPSIVATVRKAENLSAIIVLNLFAGWTFLGWVGSLVWALAAEKKTPPTESSE